MAAVVGKATATGLLLVTFLGGLAADVPALVLGSLLAAVGWPVAGSTRRRRAAARRRAVRRAAARRNLQARVVAVHDALSASQLAAPAPIEGAYREVVGALVAVLCCLNDQVAALEQQVAARFADHRDAAIIRSQPGLGAVLGARVLGEFGGRPSPLPDGQGPQGLRRHRPGHPILGPS